MVNRSAGLGAGEDLARALETSLNERLGPQAAVEMRTVSDHPEAAGETKRFLASNAGPAAVVVAGGGGSLRAVIEAVFSFEDGPDRVRVGALRMGSGNVIAKRLGVPRDPMAGIEVLARALARGDTVSGCVLRAETETVGGETKTQYAVTMCGLGQFGKVPGDLARWHERHPRWRALAAKLVGLERVNDLEYAMAVVLRSLGCALDPLRCDDVEIVAGGATRSLRLLAGVVLNFPIPAIPLHSMFRFEDPGLTLHAMRFRGRLGCLWLALRPARLAGGLPAVPIEPGADVEIRFRRPETVEFFLDEDPETAHRRLRLSVAGRIPFVAVRTSEE